MNSSFCTIDYMQFLSKQDLIWDQLPSSKQWDGAPFLGNGILGTMLYGEDRCLQLEMGHSLVYDHREMSPDEIDRPKHPNDFLYYRCRLPIGHFALQFASALADSQMQLDLYNAELKGTLGAVRFRSIVHTDEMLSLFLFERDSVLPTSVGFVPAKAESPRQTFAVKQNDQGRILPSYRPNPAAQIEQNGEMGVCVQPLENGWQTVTAWRWMPTENGMLLAATVSHGQNENLREQAVEQLLGLNDAKIAALFTSHRKWWSDYYTKSFLSIPDAQLESFYWIQMYKMACATRADRVVMDNQGPWVQDSPWPGIWWNLNVQLAYSPVFAANHTELFESVSNALTRYEANLINNVEPEYRSDSAAFGTASDYELRSHVKVPGKDGAYLLEIGNLTWMLHSCWQYYRMHMDRDYLKDTLFPLLRRSIAYALHFTFQEDGTWHLMPTTSPEYGVAGQDTNYELALLAWGLETLLFCNAELGLDAPEATHWQDVFDHLADYPSDEKQGYYIAKDVPYEFSHRHGSHLMMAYPLHLVNCEQQGATEQIVKTIEQWQSLTEELAGFSFTQASSMYAAVGDGDNALRYLQGLWGGSLRYNTLYREAGPVIETPLSAARCIQDMLLQSWGGKIRLFPALPSLWQDIAIRDMRAEGAFLISALRENGKTQFVRIRSLKGEACVLKCDLIDFKQSRSDINISRLADGTYQIDLPEGEEIVLFAPGYEGEYTVKSVETDPALHNCYGINKRADTWINKDYFVINW